MARKATPLYGEWDSRKEREYRRDCVPNPFIRDSDTYHHKHFIEVVVPHSEKRRVAVTLSREQAKVISEELRWWLIHG